MSDKLSHKSLLSQLKERKTLPLLKPNHVWNPSMDNEIAALSELKLADDRPDGIQSARAWKAVLHLWNDSLDAAHELVQDMQTPTGSLLHGIMHRREGDYDNAKYWFHRAGEHPAFSSLQTRTASFIKEQPISSGPQEEILGMLVIQGNWNPYLFTDAAAIQDRRIGEDNTRAILEQIQKYELESLIRYLEGRISV